MRVEKIVSVASNTQSQEIGLNELLEKVTVKYLHLLF